LHYRAGLVTNQRGYPSCFSTAGGEGDAVH
jgi:hypothetical protein